MGSWGTLGSGLKITCLKYSAAVDLVGTGLDKVTPVSFQTENCWFGFSSAFLHDLSI